MFWEIQYLVANMMIMEYAHNIANLDVANSPKNNLYTDVKWQFMLLNVYLTLFD